MVAQTSFRAPVDMVAHTSARGIFQAPRKLSLSMRGGKHEGEGGRQTQVAGGKHEWRQLTGEPMKGERPQRRGERKATCDFCRCLKESIHSLSTMASLTPSVSLTSSLSPSLPLSRSLPLCLPHSRSLPHNLTLLHSLSLPHSLSLSPSRPFSASLIAPSLLCDSSTNQPHDKKHRHLQ